MKKTAKKFNTVKILGLLIAVVFFIITNSSFAQPGTTALLIQQTPEGAGTVTPNPGIHRLELNSSISLTAIPKQGYEFLYWMGDVSDPETRTTFLSLDSPKIVIAVFERVSYFAAVPTNLISTPIGGVFASRADYSRGGISPIGRIPHGVRRSGTQKEEEPPENEFPVPEVPEPATSALFLMGSLYVFAKNKKRNLGSAGLPKREKNDVK